VAGLEKESGIQAARLAKAVLIPAPVGRMHLKRLDSRKKGAFGFCCDFL
jgi:hypothetical protein